MSPKEEMGVGVMEAANPEFQVVREKEGGPVKKEGEQSRDGTRDAVSSLERGREMWGG